MSRPPPTTHIRPALSIQVAQLRGDDDASPGDASPGSAAGPLKRVSPRKGISRRMPYPISTSPLAAGESQTPGLSSKLADFSMLTPREDGTEDERPVSTRTRRRGADQDAAARLRGSDAGFSKRRTSPLGADARAADAAEAAVIAQVERSLVAVSQGTSAVGRPPPSARTSQASRPGGGLSSRGTHAPAGSRPGERGAPQVPPRGSSLRPVKRASAEPPLSRRAPTPRGGSHLNPARRQPVNVAAPTAHGMLTQPPPRILPRALTPPAAPPPPPPQDVPLRPPPAHRPAPSANLQVGVVSLP